jgi:hypothetical protein
MMSNECDPSVVPDYVWEGLSSARECAGCSMYDMNRVVSHLLSSQQRDAATWLSAHSQWFTEVVLWSFDPKYYR